jgi:hypothetical protein
MADFFSRIFAIPSSDDDDDTYSAEDTFSQGSSIQRPKKSKRRSSNNNRRSSADEDDEESSNSESLDDKHRGRQRRNDAASYRGASSGPKKKRSSSERPGITSSKPHSNTVTGRRRTSRSLSKVPAERERPLPPVSPTGDIGDDETQKKMKGWRSKFSKGVKKHKSPTEKSPPLPSKSHTKRSQAGSNNEQQQPINVGDYITISQQYLEETTDMSVLTLPRELNNNTNKEIEEEILMQVGQQGVLGNNAVQAFLDRRSTPAYNEEMKLQHSSSVDNGVSYERVSTYATKLLDISHSQSLENGSTTSANNEEGMEVSEDYANHQVGKHRWPCDPTAVGYEPAGEKKKTTTGTDNSVVTEEEIGSIDMPPPPPSPTSNIQQRVADDPSGIRLPSPISERCDAKQLESVEKRRPFDDPSPKVPQDETEKPTVSKSNKSVSFNLPPPSVHPPAPPFLGPTLDYYYSMERHSNDQLPIWSNSLILPPIIELWSSVEDRSGDAAGERGWDREKEMELVGEEYNPFLISQRGMQPNDKVEVEESMVSKEPINMPMPMSPGEKSIEHIHNILDCGDEEDEAPMDEKEGLKIASSSLSIKTDPVTSTETEAAPEDAQFRHRSQWKSSQNMTYKPPMFNNGVQKELRMGRSESSEDSVLQLRRIHGDEVPSPKTQPQDADRPVILHGRVVRHANVSPNASNLSKSSSIVRSPSTASYGSISSHNAKTYAARSIQAAVRGMLERQRFMIMINSVLVIQPEVRRYICRRRYLMQLKLKRSYFPSNWKRRVLQNGCV